MTARYVALVVAGMLLTACGTTSSSDDASAPSPGKRLVVRGAVVPDDPEPSISAAKTKKPRAAKASSGPVLADGADGADASGGSTTPLVSPSVPSGGSGTSGGAAGGAGGSGTVAGTGVSPEAPSASVTSEPLAPIEPTPTVSAEPAPTRTPTPSPFAIDFRDMLNTTVAGFPLWLMVLVGIILAAALVFGTGGRRERAPREERGYEPYAERDRERERQTRYDVDDAEPEPA